MIYRDITYTNYDGEEITDRFYFNLSRADLIRMDMQSGGDLASYMKKVVESGDNEAIWSMFEKIVTLSVGKKSIDGKRFDRSTEAKKDFLESDAYSEFLYMLMTDNYGTEPNYAQKFVSGLVDEQSMNRSLKKIEEYRAKLGEQNANSDYTGNGIVQFKN